MKQDNQQTENMEENVEVRNTEEKKGITPKAVVRELISWVLTIAAAIVLALILNKVVFINATIPSGSMENTILEGDRLLGLRLAYIGSEPERGDIIIFKYPDNEEETYIKRIVGLPGETVEIKDAKIYINGSATPLEEDYLKDKWVEETGPYYYEVPQDCYLVLGDNRNNSKDARYWVNTYVTKDQIIGKAWFRYYPFDSMGILD